MNNELFSRLKDLAQKENRARLAVLLGAAAMLLFAIPIAGFVLAVVWSFGGTHNEARKRLARAQVVRTLVVAAAAALLLILFRQALGQLLWQIALAVLLAYAARPRAGLEKETSLPKQSSLRARFMYWAMGPRPCVGYTLPLRLA